MVIAISFIHRTIFHTGDDQYWSVHTGRISYKGNAIFEASSFAKPRVCNQLPQEVGLLNCLRAFANGNVQKTSITVYIANMERICP